MPELKVDTSKSEYSPIIVDIDGKKFEVIEMTQEEVRELNEYDKILESDMLAPYRRLAWLLNLKEDSPILKKMHPKRVNRITEWIVRMIYSADEAEMKDLTPSQKKKKSSGASGRKQ